MPDLAPQARRAADQAEKEAFEERLRLRDEARTRKIAEAKLSKEELAVRTPCWDAAPGYWSRSCACPSACSLGPCPVRMCLLTCMHGAIMRGVFRGLAANSIGNGCGFASISSTGQW